MDLLWSSGDNSIKKKNKTKKKLLNKKEYFKYDFDLDNSFYENSDNSSDSEYKTKCKKCSLENCKECQGQKNDNICILCTYDFYEKKDVNNKI